MPIALLGEITAQDDINRRNRLVEQHLTCFVPYLRDISPQAVLTIRKREEESFLLFRQKLNQAVDQVLKNKGKFNEEDAKQIFQDILRPQLALLDKGIKSASRGLVSEAATTALSWTAAIGFGMYTGILPTGIAAALGTVGATKTVAEAVKKSIDKSRAENKARESDVYFLWKIRQQARPKSKKS